MVVDILRETLAGIGFAFDNAILYKTGDIAQQKAAAKAASSPITSITLALTSSERL
jgi:hypothetical protein